MRAAADLIVTAGLSPGAWGFPKVAGHCPTCDNDSLFLAVGGHVTCALLACPDPCAADDLLHKEHMNRKGHV